MVATVSGEKLLIGRRPVRNWTRRLFLCRQLHMFLEKSTKTAANKAAFFDSNMHQIVCRLGFAPDPLAELTAVFRGPTSKGTGGEGERRAWERKGRGSLSFAPGRKKIGTYATRSFNTCHSILVTSLTNDEAMPQCFLNSTQSSPSSSSSSSSSFYLPNSTTVCTPLSIQLRRTDSEVRQED